MLTTYRESFESDISQVKENIQKKCEELKKEIDLYRDKLIKEVDDIMIKHSKELEAAQDKVELCLISVENFGKYSEELKVKATASELSRVASDLHERAQQLIKQSQHVADEFYKKICIKFENYEANSLNLRQSVGVVEVTESPKHSVSAFKGNSVLNIEQTIGLLVMDHGSNWSPKLDRSHGSWGN